MRDFLRLTLLLTFIAIVVVTIVGCDYQPVEPVEVTPVTLDKTAPAPTPTPFPYLQEFHNVPVEFSVSGQDITVEIQNRHLFQIAHDYFAVLTYPSGQVMIFLTNPSAMTFIIPYFGTEDLQNITLMAIFEFTN